MTDGPHTPRIQTHPDQPANLTDHTAGSEPAPAKPCQPPVTSRQIGPLAQAERRPGEFLRLATVDAAQAQHWRGRGFGGWGGAHRGFGGFGGPGLGTRGFGYGGFGRLAVNRGYGGYYGGYYRPRGWGWGGFGAGRAAGALVGGLASGPAYGWGYGDDYYGYPAVATAPVVYETAPAPVVVRRVVYRSAPVVGRRVVYRSPRVYRRVVYRSGPAFGYRRVVYRSGPAFRGY